MASFKVPCPSCEAPVLIKNPNLVGTKVECPKCKYRFKVEEPAPAAGAPAATDKKADKADKKVKAAGGKNKKLVPIVVGVLALVILGGVGFAVLGGKKKPIDPFAGTSGGSRGGGGADPVEDPDKDKKPVDPPKPAVPFSDKVATNLLPGQSVAVYRFNMEKLRGSPLNGALVDQPVTTMFQGTFGFAPEDVGTYLHCYSGEGRDPFGVIKLKTPAKSPDLLAKMPLLPKPKVVKGRELHEFRAAPFLHAITSALAMRSLFGELYSTVPMASATPPKDKPFGLCVYDTQHVLVGDYVLLEKFLGELAENGYPPFKSELSVAPPPPAPVPGKTEPNTAKIDPKTGKADTTPPKPSAPKSGPSTASGYTTVDAYRTIEFPLKQALDALEADTTVSPLLVYAEKFDSRQYDPQLMKKDYSGLSTAIDPIAVRLRYLSGNVTTFGYRQLVANLRLTFDGASDASEMAKEKLGPGLEAAVELLKLYLTTNIGFRDYTLPGAVVPMGPNSPMGPMGPGGPSGPMLPPPPAGGPGMAPGLGEGGPQPGGSFGGPPPRPGGPPAGMGEGPGPGPGGPTGPGVPPKDQGPQPSHVDLAIVDNQLLITIDITWTDSVYRTTIAPRLNGIANQIKGKMAVFSAQFGPELLSQAGPKANAANKTFPRGTHDRARTDPARLGLEYPPIQRVSLFVELLPHLGRGRLANQVNKNAAWYALEYDPPDPAYPNAPPKKRLDNLTPGGEWVPELLVPTYPQAAWRATSPLAPDHTFGATNYVALSGTGIGSARYDPNNPVYKKQVGMTGYGWGSKTEDVTDGLSNTIYLIQTPPGLQQPWIAGGGATVRGFDENNPMSGYTYTHGGKQGTYALMGDGSVRFIPATIDPKVLLALGTRAGGEALADLDTHAPPLVPQKPPAPPTDVKPDPKPDEKKDKGTDPAPKAGPASKLEEAPAPREKK